MNKNISLAINIVLGIAVAVLYYLHFTSKASCTADGTAGEDSAAVSKPIVMAPKEIKASKIVFVNTDILNEKYEYVKDLTAEAKRKQASLAAIYDKKEKQLQDRYAELSQKASQGLLSENQQKEGQVEIEKGRADLEQIQGQEQQLMQQLQMENMKVYNSISQYLNEYNKHSLYNYILAYSSTTISPVLAANDSLDITAEIVEGLNAQYKAQKGAQKGK
jgi:outer membrane protein